MNERTASTLGRAMERNVLEVFGERDAVRRERALADLYVDDCAFYEADGTFIGRAAIANRAQQILDQGPPEFAISVVGSPDVIHDLGRLRWQVGPAGGLPVVTGMDVALFADGKIKAMYTFLDTPEVGGTADGSTDGSRGA